jgi:hypothetical protein
MPDVFDFTRLGVSACRENAKRRFRRDREPVAKVTRGPAAIVKLGPEPVRFRFMRFPGFRFVGLAVAEHQYLCAHLPLHLRRAPRMGSIRSRSRNILIADNVSHEVEGVIDGRPSTF